MYIISSLNCNLYILISVCPLCFLSDFLGTTVKRRLLSNIFFVILLMSFDYYLLFNNYVFSVIYLVQIKSINP